MICKNCGSKLNDGDVFCWNCGASLQNGNISNQEFNNMGVPLNNNNNNNNYNNNNYNGIPNYGNDYNNVPNNQYYQKKKKTKINIAIVLILLFIGFLIMIGLYFVFTRDENGQIKKDLSILTLESVSFKYDSSLWKTENISSTTGNSENMKSLKYNSYYVVFVYSDLQGYSSSADFANSLKRSYENSGVKIINNAGSQKLSLNGIDWYVLKYENGGKTYYQLVYANRDGSYSLTYFTDSSKYDTGFKYFETLFKTLVYDSSVDLNKQNDAKDQLVGEWDWGKLGYFVITQDMIYLYQDSSKSMNNVHYGSYSSSDSIPNVGYGKIDGLYVIVNYTSSYIDGVSTPMKTSEREYTFVKYSDGLYKINDLVSGASDYAKKVK